ncbi:MAG: HPr family phosphocarrier protein [Desulfobacteraceae bacterium]|nr:HPr family phosphocarrier protein [Desulfobacteraceae bacterium]
MEKSCDITFKEKVNLFSYEYLKCIKFIIDSIGSDYILTKKLYSKLITTSHLLEDLLDFHGAKNNKEWVYYREFCALIRHFSLAGYSQKHIINRYNFYNVKKDETVQFKQEANDTLKMIQNCLEKASPVILVEAERLGIRIPDFGYRKAYFPEILSGQHLEHNIDEFEDTGDQGKNLTRIASEFLEIIKDFEYFAFYEKYDHKKLRELVPEKINEVEIRRFEMLLHNLQSSFDSYVISSRFSSSKMKLNQLRGHFSIVFHILQVAGRLLHFYERHLHDVGHKDVYKSVSELLSKMVESEILLDRTVNSCLFYAWQFLSSGKELALEIVNENMERGSINVGIPKDRGFHSRPSMLVAKIVRHYGGEVNLCIGEDKFDASSVLDIQWAGGKIKKENIEEIIFQGDLRALADIKVLSLVNYGEDSMGKGIPLPVELTYLH